MKIKKLNEDCGCSGSTPSSEPKQKPISKDLSNSNVGKVATLFDGRQALVNDSIRNSSGQIIGYVLNDNRGAFRVFKDKIQNFSESEGAMSSLSATVGIGNVIAPTADHVGSGDKFPSLDVGTPAAKPDKKIASGRKKNQFTNVLMDFTTFSKKFKGFQQPDKTNKK